MEGNRMDSITIQIRDYGGSWVAVATNVPNDPQVLNIEMKSVQKRYADRRVRAVTAAGHLIDFL